MTTSTISSSVSVSTSTTTSYTVVSGGSLIDASGGNVTGTQVQSGGSLVVNGGTETSATISAGATEIVSAGSASGDLIFGVLSNLSGAADYLTSEAIESGGKFYEVNSGIVSGATVLAGGSMFVNGNTSGVNLNTVLDGGGYVQLQTAKATLGGVLTFEGGSNVLAISAVISTGYGDQAVISGFSATDKIDIQTVAPSALTFATSGGNTVVTVSGSDKLIFAGTSTYTSNTLSTVTDSHGGEYVVYTPASSGGVTSTVSTGQTSTGLTVSNGETLIVQSGGSISSTIVQSGGAVNLSGSDTSATVSVGGTLNVFGSASGDAVYGSATVSGATSAETVENGGALVVAVGATDSGATVLSGGVETVAGTANGAQIHGAVSTVSGVAGVVSGATVFAGGTLDVANANDAINATVSSGGVLTISGAGSATGVTDLTSGGQLWLESPKAEVAGSLVLGGGGNVIDVTAVASAGYGLAAAISGFTSSDKIDVNAGLTGATLAFTSNGDGTETVTLAGTSGGSSVSESFVFASAATYNAYTITSQGDGSGGVDIGFNPNQTTLVVSGGQTSTGLAATSGETISVLAGGTVSSTVVNSGGSLTVSGLDKSATVSGTETVYGSGAGDKIYGAATVSGAAAITTNETVYGGGALSIFAGANQTATISSGGSESVASSGTTSGDQIFGSVSINGAGASANQETVGAGGSLAVTGGSETSATISLGGAETVTNAGSAAGDQIYGSVAITSANVSSETIYSGGVLTINAGGVDSGSTIEASGSETVLGSASGDKVYGTQLVSAATAVVTNETVYAGGNLDVFLKGAIASGTIVSSGGSLNISGFAYAKDTVLSGGGVLSLQSPKAEVTGALTFEGGGNTYEITGATSAGFGDQGLISGFSSTDTIDITSSAFADVGLTISQSVNSGGNTVANVMSGGVAIETFTFAGAANLGLTTDGNGGADVVLLPTSVTTSVTTSTAPGAYEEPNTDTLLVLSGGSVSAATIDAGGFLIVNGGDDAVATVLSGGLETVSAGSASGDQIYGSTVVNGGAVTGETVFGGGAMTVNGGVANNTVLNGGGLTVNGGVVSNVTLNGGALVDLASTSATLSGTLTFTSAGETLRTDTFSSAGAGDQATISGFASSDKIELTNVSSSDASLHYAAGAGNTEIVTVSGAGGSESFVFADASVYNAGTMALIADGTGVDLVLKTTPVVAFTSPGLSANTTTQIVNGTVDVTADPEAVGTTVTVTEGSTTLGTATVGANGFWSADVNLLNSNGTNTLNAADTDKAGQTGTTGPSLTYDVNTAAAAFIPGNLVISVYGDGAGTGSYTLDQAAPITLEQITTTGSLVSQLVLPETPTTVNGVTENAISGEYGSASEGLLQLSADGQSLTIMGYGVSDVAFNASNDVTVYGTNALGQTTSLSGGGYTDVARVVADINANGVIDTSTALTGVFNSNNPRSVVTVDGKEFWIAGQGVKGDTTQGVFYTTDGSSTATAINTATDTRIAEIYNGQLYVSADSTQGATNISDYGALPTSATPPIVLNAIANSVTLTAATANSVNASASGTSVNLSPESFFFANATTLYVADSGLPKNGGVGDGGLQKWVETNGTWNLDYTLSAGLNLVDSTQASSGVSGLIGLTGEVVNGNVELFATTEGVAELDKSYLYSIDDSLASTTGAGESFTRLMTAGDDQIIRGVAFAPTTAPCFCSGVRILTARGEVAVEGLEIGDQVVTFSGRLRPIVWIGRRKLDLRKHRDPNTVWPVRVAADAFGAGAPHRELWLSPGHNIAFEGALLPIRALVNGVSVAQVPHDTVEYWHVELDAHDVLYAEGLPSESYLDCGNRGAFENGGAFIEAHPDFAPKHWRETCLPLFEGGPAVTAARRHLFARLAEQGHEIVEDADVHLLADGRRIEPMWLNAGKLAFVAPQGCQTLLLQSDTFIPAHTCLGNVDPRELGICVKRLHIDGDDVVLDDARLESGNWRACEVDETGVARRWTCGSSRLPAGARIVMVELGGRGYYLRRGTNTDERIEAQRA